MNSFILKILGIVLMVLDHVYTYLPDITIWFGYLGKLSAPIFFFLIVEGFIHTRSRNKYMLRLLAFGVFMLGIDYILGINNNIFLSLGVSVALLNSIDYGKRTKNYIGSIALSLILSFLMVFTEASIYGLGMVLIFYFLREKRIWMYIAYILLGLAQILLVINTPDLSKQLFLFDYQWMMIFSLPFFIFYNGQKGLSNGFTKWLFYIFYPLHLIIIVGITKMIGV